MNNQSLFQIIVVIMSTMLCMSFVACSSDDGEDNTVNFAGTYNVSVIENVTWGKSSGTTTSTGVIYITTSGSTATMTGMLSSSGQIVGNTIYFMGGTSQDNAGYTTSTYGPATLTGNVLRFRLILTGQLLYNCVAFPYNSSSDFTCIKQ